MIVNIKYNGKELSLVYDDIDGYFERAFDVTVGEPMMIEYTQLGSGYEFSKHEGLFLPMNMCKGIYIRIIDLDLFVPKYIFIANNS